MGERVTPKRFILKYVTDIAAIEGHGKITFILMSVLGYYKDIPGIFPADNNLQERSADTCFPR